MPHPQHTQSTDQQEITVQVLAVLPLRPQHFRWLWAGILLLLIALASLFAILYAAI